MWLAQIFPSPQTTQFQSPFSQSVTISQLEIYVKISVTDLCQPESAEFIKMEYHLLHL
jgi:hypothetical protein